MNRLTSHITIGNENFDFLVNCDISQSIETLTDTCKITLPRKLKWVGKNISLDETPVFKRGDAVKVMLGYDGLLKVNFLGYVKKIGSGIPVELFCEDEMFSLKVKPITHSYPSVTLRQLLKEQLPSNISYIIPEGEKEINLAKLRITNASMAKVLEEIKSNYGLYSYFRNIEDNNDVKSVLYSGLAYWTDHRNSYNFEYKRNIIDSSLQYIKADEARIKIKAVSILDNNQKHELEFGDEDGEIRTVLRYGISKQELKVYAEQEYERFKFDGLRGSFITFGEPKCEKGDIAVITGDTAHPDGKYLIKAITKSFGINGYRQTIELDTKIE